MVSDRIDLSQVLKRYKARVIRITPLDDYYLLETNRGPKELRIWPRVDVMRWSFAWREQMARLGFRDVERFIRTRDAKPYLVVGKRGFTLTDHLRKVDAYLPTVEHIRTCGQLVANMHQAQHSNHLFAAPDLLNKEQRYAVTEAKRARALYEAFLNGPRSEREKWVASQFPPLLERMERSAELLESGRIDAELVTVSHRHLGKDNWGLVNDKVYLHGFYRPTLSVQLRDAASFLREMYSEHEDVELVTSFLDGYEQNKPMTYAEYTLLLAFMAYPQEAWRSMEQYVNKALEHQQAEEMLRDIEQALEKQQLVDHLLQHIAHRAERPRSGAVYESI